MKNILIILAIFFFSWSFSQEENLNNKDTTPFAVLEKVPIYKGCKKFKNNIDLKKCMSEKIVKLVSKNFNTRIANKLNLPNDL